MEKRPGSQTARLMNGRRDLITRLFWEALVVGALVGVVSVIYRYLLTLAEDFYFYMAGLARGKPLYLGAMFLLLLALACLVSFLLKWEPNIGGSGIPQVEAEIQGRIDQIWWRVLPAKIAGGVFAVMGGLSLGREGPSIQLGAMVGKGMGRLCRRTTNETHYLMTCGGGAGLSAAFNAPLAGILFALEEVHKNFNKPAVVSVMTASVVADMISKYVFGLRPVLHFNIVKILPMKYYGWLLVLGLVLGVMGAFYNWVTMSFVQGFKKVTFLEKHQRVLLAFVLSGFVGMVFPLVTCGGGKILAVTNADAVIGSLLLLYFGKLLFSAFSFGSGAPGGIFFPLLVLGSLLGAIVGKLAIMAGLPEIYFVNFIVFAMAAYFSAIVRAPVTGIVLVAEMSGTLKILLPMVITSFIAYFVANLLKSSPIYESLMENLLVGRESEDPRPDIHKELLSYILPVGAEAVNKTVSELPLETILLVSVLRGKDEFIPHGDTRLLAGDQIIILLDREKILEKKKKLDELFSLE